MPQGIPRYSHIAGYMAILTFPRSTFLCQKERGHAAVGFSDDPEAVFAIALGRLRRVNGVSREGTEILDKRLVIHGRVFGADVSPIATYMTPEAFFDTRGMSDDVLALLAEAQTIFRKYTAEQNKEGWLKTPVAWLSPSENKLVVVVHGYLDERPIMKPYESRSALPAAASTRSLGQPEGSRAIGKRKRKGQLQHVQARIISRAMNQIFDTKSPFTTDGLNRELRVGERVALGLPSSAGSHMITTFANKVEKACVTLRSKHTKWSAKTRPKQIEPAGVCNCQGHQTIVITRPNIHGKIQGHFTIFWGHGSRPRFGENRSF